jgi:hypothetical protein
MPQNQVFGFELASRFEAVAQHANEKEANCNHAAIMFWFAADRESNGLSFRKRQQSALADLIITVVKERKVQVILESHSEHVLQRLLRRIAEGKTSKYPALSPDDVKLFFCRSVKGESALDQLKVNLFGSIENWPRDFFGDQFGEITAREEAALKRQRAAEWLLMWWTKTSPLSPMIAAVLNPRHNRQTLTVDLRACKH